MNSYFYDGAAFKSSISSFENQLDTYSNDLKTISRLKDTIENSNEWVQNNVKPSFVNKYNDYIVFFTVFNAKLEAHLNYLKGKHKAMESLEEAYSRRS